MAQPVRDSNGASYTPYSSSKAIHGPVGTKAQRLYGDETSDVTSLAPQTPTRSRVIQILLIVPKTLLTTLTVPTCAALEFLSGYAVGLIISAGIVSKLYTNYGLKVTIPFALLMLPASLLLGTGVAFIGFFVGIYDGYQLGWNQKPAFKDTANTVDSFIQSYGLFSSGDNPVIYDSEQSQAVSQPKKEETVQPARHHTVPNPKTRTEPSSDDESNPFSPNWKPGKAEDIQAKNSPTQPS